MKSSTTVSSSCESANTVVSQTPPNFQAGGRAGLEERPPLVLIESPYRNGSRADNLRYLAWCEYHAAERGECPIASHGNCTAYWPEDDAHRALGFRWRARVAEVVDYVVYYTDLGISPGARLAMAADKKAGRRTEERGLRIGLLREFEAGKWPPGSMRKVPVDACALEVERT